MRILLATAVALLIAAAPAAAAPTPGATYGGGHVLPSTKVVGPLLTAAVEVGADGRTARVVAYGVFGCGSKRNRRSFYQQFFATGTIEADGRLRMQARTRHYLYVFAGSRPRGRATLDVRFDGPAASGTVRFASRLKGKRCAKTAPVQLRAAAPDAGPAAPAPADAYLYGTSDALYHRVRSPVALHVRPDGSRIDILLAEMPLRCDGPRTDPFTDMLPNQSPPTRIRPDGTFSRTERFSMRTREGVTRTVVRVQGRFTAAGVTGTYSTTARNRRTGKRCRTGRIAWSAVR